MFRGPALAFGLALLAGAGAARAQDYQPHAGSFGFHMVGAGVLFSPTSKFTLAGHPVAGASAALSDNATLAVGAEYYLRKDLSLSVTVGVPPTTTATGKGSLAPLGKLGSVQYGPGTSYVRYHFGGLDRIQPWLGAGVTRMLVFGETDGAITRLKVHPSWGAAVQGGVLYMLTPRWGVNASVSHLFLRTHGSGVLEGLPVGAKIGLDPTIVEGGLTLRY